jgi:ABC-2 type transport system ATP-binding protein
MKQKLALACTLIHSPDVLLLDEPTTGVDPVTRRELWKLLGELVARGLTLVVATPYLDEAERCTRVVLMHHGRVLADAAPAAIVEELPGTIVEVHASPRSDAETALHGASGVTDLTVFGASLHVRLEGAADPLSSVRDALETSGVEVRDLRQIPGGLEDAFLYLTQRPTTPAEAT